MLCDVVLALVVTFTDGSKQTVQRQGATQAQAKGAQEELAKAKKDPAFTAQMISQGVQDVEIAVKNFPPFDCTKDPEAKPEGK